MYAKWFPSFKAFDLKLLENEDIHAINEAWDEGLSLNYN